MRFFKTRLFILSGLFPFILVRVILGLSACRTVSENEDIKSAKMVSCVGNEAIAALRPGGLFASSRIIYNQHDVSSGVIHPEMVEQDASGSLGLYHTYIPSHDTSAVMKSLAEIKAMATEAVGDHVVVGSPQNIKLTGTDHLLNVFRFQALQLSQARSLEIEVPDGASAVLIVRGDAVSFASTIVKSNALGKNTLWVFPDSASVSIRGDVFVGTIIAPDAQVTIDPAFFGSAFAKNLRVRWLSVPELYQGCLIRK